MAMAKVPNSLIGAAGVHFVVSELSLRGVVAIPTVRNTAGVDVLVFDPETVCHAGLQVKTSGKIKPVSFWPTSLPEHCLRGDSIYYVFVRYDAARDNSGCSCAHPSGFEAFLDDSDRVVRQIARNIRNQKKSGRKKLFPCWYLPKAETEQAELARRWSCWRP